MFLFFITSRRGVLKFCRGYPPIPKTLASKKSGPSMSAILRLNLGLAEGWYLPDLSNALYGKYTAFKTTNPLIIFPIPRGNRNSAVQYDAEKLIHL